MFGFDLNSILSLSIIDFVSQLTNLVKSIPCFFPLNFNWQMKATPYCLNMDKRLANFLPIDVPHVYLSRCLILPFSYGVV